MSPDFLLHKMEQKALTGWRRESWDKEGRDRVPQELGCHQPIPGHSNGDEGFHSLGGVPSFSGQQNKWQNCAKEVPCSLYSWRVGGREFGEKK